MKKAILFCTLTLCLCFAVKPTNVKAGTVAAGEITYEWISDSTYRFYLTYYKDCSGIPPTLFNLCFNNPCNTIQSFTTLLSFYSTIAPGSPVAPTELCPSYNTQCQDLTATLPGYQLSVYSAMVTLPGRCNAWRITALINDRNNSDNLATPSGKPYYAEARFNNTSTYLHNSSPYFKTGPIAYIYNGVPFVYNNNAVDPDGDSLVTDVIDPLTASSCTSTPTATGYVTATPVIHIPDNPFQTNNTLSNNPVTGNITFTPAQAGKQTLAVRISEYRHGVLIGSQTREAQFQVLNGTVTIPSVAHLSVSTSGGRIQACTGEPLSFSFDILSSDHNARLIVSDNSFIFSTANVTYTHQNSDSVHVSFNWLPPLSANGLWGSIFTIRDSSCRPPGVILKTVYSRPIYVWPLGPAVNDTSICIGDTALLSIPGGTTATWSILPGGTLASLSCTTCLQPKAYPVVNTKYKVVSANTICPVPTFTDTVAVTVLTNLTHPGVHIIASSDTNVAAGTTVTFTATTLNCAHPSYQWKRNAIAVSGATTTTYTTSSLSNNDVITCELVCNDTCPRPKDTMSNPLTMHIGTSVNRMYSTHHISIYPNPNNGNFTIKAMLTGLTSCNVHVINTVGQTVYQDVLKVQNAELNETLKLQVPPGVYVLKLSNETLRFSVK